MKIKEINLGAEVRRQMRLKGFKQADLAKELGLHARSIPQFIRRKHYNSRMLIRLSNILEHDFLQYLYADPENSVNNQLITSLRNEITGLQKEIDFLKKIMGKIK